MFSCAAPAQQPNSHTVLDHQIRAELGFLASDALQGRGSGTHDELVAATYIASELARLGLKPGGDNGGYIQDVSGDFKFFRGETKHWDTRNVIASLPGRDPKLKDEVILLTAHLDHLGVGKPVNGETIYRGADDDASGCVAVLQLARVLAQEEPP